MESTQDFFNPLFSINQSLAPLFSCLAIHLRLICLGEEGRPKYSIQAKGRIFSLFSGLAEKVTMAISKSQDGMLVLEAASLGLHSPQILLLGRRSLHIWPHVIPHRTTSLYKVELHLKQMSRLGLSSLSNL